MTVGMTPTEIGALSAAIAGGVATLIAALFGKPVIDAIERLLTGAHQRWMEKRKLRREEMAATDQRKADRAAHEEKTNERGYKGLVTRLDAELTELKQEFRRSQQDAHECHARCATLMAQNDALRQDCDENRDEIAKLRSELDRMKSQRP